MTQPRPWDVVELAAGNVRGLPGGDPLAARPPIRLAAEAETARIGRHRRPGLAARILKAITR